MESFLKDLGFAFRSTWRRPTFSLIVVLTLALGIGANVTLASLARSLLLRQLTFSDAERVMLLWRENRFDARNPFSIPTFEDWSQRNRAFEFMAAFRSTSLNLTGGEGEPERIAALTATADFSRALGIEPVLGRPFRSEDDQLGAERTTLLSHQLWQRRFGGDPAIVGQSIELDGEPYAVIGVLPTHLARETLGAEPLGDLWLPLGIFYDQLPVDGRADHFLLGVGRLRDGVTRQVALGDMDRIISELAAEYPDAYTKNKLLGATLPDEAFGDLRRVLGILLTSVGFVLLIACANLINLFLTRATYRERELAIRTSLGASRFQLIRQLLIESLFLAVLGGLVGLAGSHLVVSWLPRLLSDVDHVDQARVDGPAIALALALSLVVSVFIGFLPALLATRSASRRNFGGRHLSTRSTVPHRMLRQVLVVVELALALVLLIGASLLLQSLERLRAQDPGFDAERLLTLQLTLPQSRYLDRLGWTALFDEVLERVAALPGAENTAVASIRPLDGGVGVSILAARDRPLPPVPEMSVAVYQMVSPGYFRTMGIPLLKGRGFGAEDDDRRDAERVVVISRDLAERIWGETSPLGRMLAFEFKGTPAAPEPQWRRVVGVVGETRFVSLSEAPRFSVYAPYTQIPLWFEGESQTMTVMVRTFDEPLAMTRTVRSALLAIDPHQPVHGVRAMSDVVAAQLDRPRRASSLALAFAGLAFVLALIGVYGVIAYSVAHRTREIATRIAFGASSAGILRLILGQGAKTIAVGVVAGMATAWGLTRLASSQLNEAGLLYGVDAFDKPTYAAVALSLSLVAMLATFVPSWRATRVQPFEALRDE